ncbi:hypothetical protein GON01_03435 [Sphingomonas sp. MAH-20]|uniref:Uncharacterized protein n=1 Tax=Sphingomonas horti TaxID=2682842 RepID=A0A6I4IZZ9_9SPHN|nr:hypothetical protein [Sphingomonas horti]MBA2921047.1 hypothetical protein [Sphingomonas sp. CGMCC 1.13658]MVO76991.1 hypothetical protein [Sphingomonas horti]
MREFAPRVAPGARSRVENGSQLMVHVEMEEAERIVAIGLLTEQDLDILGTGFRRAFRIDDTPCFDELLAAIDAAEKQAEEMRAGS